MKNIQAPTFIFLFFVNKKKHIKHTNTHCSRARTYYHTRCIYMLIKGKQYKPASFIAIFTRKKRNNIIHIVYTHELLPCSTVFRYVKLDSVNGWLPPRTSLLSENSVNHQFIENICAKIHGKV